MSTAFCHFKSGEELIKRISAFCSKCMNFTDCKTDCREYSCPFYSLKEGNSPARQETWYMHPREKWEKKYQALLTETK